MRATLFLLLLVKSYKQDSTKRLNRVSFLFFKKFMMINFGSLVQIGIRDNSPKLCEKKRKKKKYFYFSMGSNERKKKKENVFFFFLSFSHNLNELSLIPIWTREPKYIIMFIRISLFCFSTFVRFLLGKVITRTSHSIFVSFDIFSRFSAPVF